MKVLFISHDASRTGAPILLVNLLRWLRQNTDIDFEVLIRRDGELAGEFESIATVFRHEMPAMPTTQPGNRRPRAFLKRLLEEVGLRRPWTQESWERAGRENLLRDLRARNFNLVYANTAVVGSLLHWLSALGLPVVTHVHELESVICNQGQENWDYVTHHTDLFIAASGAVRDNLVATHGVDPSRIETVHEYLATATYTCGTELQTGHRSKLGIPADAFVVCGSGTDAWRKGTDLFIELAGAVRATQPSAAVYFVWVGGWRSKSEQQNILELMCQRGPSSQVHFTGMVTNPQDYFCAADVFALVSREDPFPLVCLESAAMGKPILCFCDAGGMPEFVEDDAGFIVPFEDTASMAERILQLMADRALLQRLGERASQKVRERHDINRSAPKISALIRKLAG